MANKTKEAEQAVKEPVYIPEYTIADLAEGAKGAFNTDKVIVLAALKGAGKETYTMEEAKKIVKAFKTKEVKN